MFEYITLVDYLRRYQNDLVLIVAMDEASQSLIGELKVYLSARGSRIRELGFRDSYAAVLYQDYLIYEEMSNNSAVEKHWSEGESLNYHGVPILRIKLSYCLPQFCIMPESLWRRAFVKSTVLIISLYSYLTPFTM